MSSVTFVTAIFNIYKHSPESDIIKQRFERFQELALTGINICLYTEPEFFDRCCALIELYPNIKVMEPVDIRNSTIVKICSQIEFELPTSRCEKKDNADFMIFINSKYEFLENAIALNPWNSTHFAWIDFSITYIFKNLKESQQYLSCLSKRTLASSFFAIGGWETEKTSFESLSESVYKVNWRFCGGFFIGDKDSVTEFIELSKQYYLVFMHTYKVLTWEVNFWSWLETFVGWKPTWFYTMFDDGIIKLPAQFYCQKFMDIKKTSYIYPLLEEFTPSSISHLYFRENHILNTRYINYLLMENGSYHFCDTKKQIITKNVISILDNNLFVPNIHYIMNDDTVELEPTVYPKDSKCDIFGFEDVRLYEYKNKIRFIATNRNFAPISSNRMIVGDYNLDTYGYENCRVIDSPNKHQYEKNWIPVIHGENEYFIYNWFPMQIYKVNYESNLLEHVHTHFNTKTAPDFYRIRGSSAFINIDNILLGVVHFSDDCRPRRYYHMLVSLNNDSLCPMKYSEPFCFQHIGVEFCTGFWKDNDEYIFWVSKMDRNPSMIRIPAHNIPLKFSFAT